MKHGSIDHTHPAPAPAKPIRPIAGSKASQQHAPVGTAQPCAAPQAQTTPPEGVENIVTGLKSASSAQAPRSSALERRRAYAKTRHNSSPLGSSFSLPVLSSESPSSSMVSLHANSDSDTESAEIELDLPTKLIGQRSPAQIRNQPPQQSLAGSGAGKASGLFMWGLATVCRPIGGAVFSQLSDFSYVGVIGLPFAFVASYLDQNNAKNDKKLGAANYAEAQQQIDALQAPLKRAMAVLATPGISDEEREMALATTVVAVELTRMLFSILDTYESAYLPPHEKNLRKADRALQTERMQKQIERAQLTDDAPQRRQALDEQIKALDQRIDELKPISRQDLKALLTEHLAQFEELRERILRLEMGVEGTPQDAADLPRLRAELDALKQHVDVLQGFVDGTRLRVLNFTEGMGNAEIKLFRDAKLFWPRAGLDALNTAIGAAASVTGLIQVVGTATGLGLAVALVNFGLAGLDRAEAKREKQSADGAITQLQAKYRKAASCLAANQGLPAQEQQILNIVVRNIMDSRLGDMRWAKQHTKAHAMRRYVKGLVVQVLGSPKQIAFIIAGLCLLGSNPGTGVPLLVTAGVLTAVTGGVFLAFCGAEQIAKKQRKDRHKRRLDASQRFVSLHGHGGIGHFYTASFDEQKRMADALSRSVPKKLRRHCSVKALLSNQPMSNAWLMDQLHQEAVNPPAPGSAPSLAAQICGGAGLATGTLGYLKQVAKEKENPAAREEMQSVLAEELFGFKRYDPSRFIDSKTPLPPADTQRRLDTLLLDAVRHSTYQSLIDILVAPASEQQRLHRLLNSPQARADLLALRHALMSSGEPPIDQHDFDSLAKANTDKELQSRLKLGSAIVSPETMGSLVQALSAPELFQDSLFVLPDQALNQAAAPRMAPTQLMKAVKQAGREDQKKHNPLARLARLIGIPTSNPMGNSSRAMRVVQQAPEPVKDKLIAAILLEYKKLLPVDNVSGQPMLPKGKSERQYLEELLLENAEQARMLSDQTQAGAKDTRRLVGKQDYRACLSKRQDDLAQLADQCVAHLRNNGAIPALPPARHGPLAGPPPVVYAQAAAAAA
jgi:hypothetical protein